jgi:hypothetical protein
MEITMNILARLSQAHLRSRAARQLRDLPPYLLQDIGVDPDHIDEAVAGILQANAVSKPALAERRPAGRRETPAHVSNGHWPYRWGAAH